jgi:hypothetical protein
MRTRMLIVIGALALVVPVGLVGLALAGSNRSATTVASQATAAFHDVDKALAAGYQPSDFPGVPGTAECFESPASGMGIHYVNGALLTDGEIDAAKPEALVYEPRANGRLKLVALEYVILQDDSSGARRRCSARRSLRTTGSRSGFRRSTRSTRGSGNRTHRGCFSPGTRARAAARPSSRAVLREGKRDFVALSHKVPSFVRR